MPSVQTRKPTIILVDDNFTFRQGIKSIINFENFGTVIGEASNGNEFLELLPITMLDMVLMDIDMPGMNGIEATRNALKINPKMKIIAFSVFANDEYCAKMIELGAMGFILKTTGINELETAIQKVMKGEQYFSDKFSKAILKETFEPNKELENEVEASPKKERFQVFTWDKSNTCNLKI